LIFFRITAPFGVSVVIENNGLAKCMDVSISNCLRTCDGGIKGG
tara:strand:+ start:256 stop:387 length:132 start_codon:yes stop_codon:yes gene_type:complete